MRTTLDIDDDVLLAVKAIAKQESRSAGAVTSSLLRKAISGASARVKEAPGKYGFTPFPRRGGIVTSELIDQLRDENGD
ncbi:MAG: hypothetical protein ABGY96_23470 [bacterium]|nr:hypothetical protein [Gammaproteobacteria bacterium]HIL94306.1 hypothetical protein [Pseudomonadales bacterium]